MGHEIAFYSFVARFLPITWAKGMMFPKEKRHGHHRKKRRKTNVRQTCRIRQARVFGGLWPKARRKNIPD